MNSAVRLIIVTALTLLAVLVVCAPDARAAARVDVLPIASIVRPFKLDPDEYDWEAIVHAHLDGRIEHDAVFRRPTGPTEAIPVDCSQTESIGVYFEVRSQSKFKDQMRPFRFSWSHDDIDSNEPVRSTFRGAWLTPKLQGVMLYGDRLKLNDARRVNGQWRLQVFHMGEEIFREEFDLVFCERPYAPRWFRDNTAQTAAVGVAAINVNDTARTEIPDDPLIAEIDATIASIDATLDDYIRDYLKSVKLRASELGSIEKDLERRVRQERHDQPMTYRQVPENIHLLQAKIQFLQSAHPEFRDGQFPQAVSDKFAKLSQLEQRLRDEEAESSEP